MKKILFLLCILCTLSCSKEVIKVDQENLDAQATLARETLNLQDTILPLDSLKIPKKAKKPLQRDFTAITSNTPFNAFPVDEFSALYQLDGILFHIQTPSTWQNRNSLTTNGKGSEITLDGYVANKAEQLFYLQFLPASSGIPYIIRSYKEGTPIGAGSYASDPNRHVLFTHNTGNSLYGASWDFMFNTTKSGYFIENQDLLGQGSGGPWDIFNYVLQMNSGQIGFAKNTGSIMQQFNIVPQGEFYISEVQFDYDNGVIVETTPTQLQIGTYPNPDYQNNATASLSFSESSQNTSTFRESSGITTRTSGTMNATIKIPFVTFGGGLTIEESNTTTTEYSNTSTQTATYTETYTFTVPPRTISNHRFIVTKHRINVPYRAKWTSVDGLTNFYVTGMYEGLTGSETYLEREFVSMDNPTTTSKQPTLKN